MARKKASKVVLNQLFTMYVGFAVLHHTLTSPTPPSCRSGPVQLKLQPFGRLGYHEYRLVAMRTDLDAITGAPYEVVCVASSPLFCATQPAPHSLVTLTRTRARTCTHRRLRRRMTG